MLQSQEPAVPLRNFLPTFAYFDDLPDEVIERLVDAVVQRQYEAGESIFLEGDPSTGLWIIETGHIKVYKINPDGVEHILHILGPRDTFNDIATFDGDGNPANAAALSRATISVIPSEVLTQLIVDTVILR